MNIPDAPLPPPRTHCAVEATVATVTHPCREHVAIELTTAMFPPSVPGQFLQLRCRDADAAADTLLEWPDGRFPELVDADFRTAQPFTRRPFSIADRWSDAEGRVHMVVLSRAVGRGTRWLDVIAAGATLDITGPLGRGFQIPANAETPLVLMGGGVGVPPLLYLARHLHELGRRDVTLILGARSRDLVPLKLFASPPVDAVPARCVELPGGAEYPAILTTDDGTLGMHGVVTGALEKWWERRADEAGERQRPAGGRSPINQAPVVVMACGPEGMLRAIAQTTRALGLACQLCIERNMGCGLGTCLSCVVRIRDAGRPQGWRWGLACSDGPVFDRDALPDYDTPGE